jgi:ElaB/YqjD/DUF883 family membrane-anchored ribosome-binding protein
MFIGGNGRPTGKSEQIRHIPLRRCELLLATGRDLLARIGQPCRFIATCKSAQAVQISPKETVMEREQMEAKLKELQAELEALAAKAEAKGEKAKADFEVQKAKLKRKIEDTRAKLKKAKTSGGTAFKDIKAGVKAAIRDIEAACKDAASRFKD